jgi:hypothetical protein
MNKRGQVQIGETIAVLLVFFILVLIGFMFYTMVIKSNLETEAEESNQLKAIELAQKASFLPEIQCSQENIIKENCIDIFKLDAASRIILNNEVFYYDKFLFSTISVEEIYPVSRNWILYDRQPPRFLNNISTPIPISLFDPTTRKNSFGILRINTFS